MFRLAAVASASLIAIAVSMPANASTISVDRITFSDGSQQVIIDSGTKRTDVYAGRLELRTTTLDELYLWCVDIFRQVLRKTYDPPIVYTLGTLTDDSDPAGPTPLSPEQIARVGGLAAAGDAALASDPGNSLISAAYQAAIWQTIYPDYSFTAKPQNVQLQAMIDMLNGDDSFAGGEGTLYTRFNSQGRVISQKLFGAGPDPIVEVPAPAAIGLFGFALAGLLFARRARA